MLRRRKKAGCSPEVRDSEETKEKAATTKSEEKNRKRKAEEETLLARAIAHVKQILSGKPIDPNKSPPFSVTPCKLDEDAFRHCNPFIDVGSRLGAECTGGLDKVQHAKDHPMNAAAYCIMAEQFGEEVEKAKTLCPREFSELGFRDIHLSYLKPLLYMVHPYVARNVQPCSDRARFMKRRRLAENPQVVESETRGFYLQAEPGTERSRLLGLDMLYEGDSGAEQRQADLNRFDIEMNAHDLNIDPELDDLVTLAYCECKRYEEDLLEAIFQAGEYSKSGAFRNMSKGRFAPIHLFGMSKANWTYGLLVPYGKVQIRDGAVVDIDSIHEADVRGYLEDKLKRATKALQEKYPGQRYPDGIYLSGFLYVEQESHLLPFRGCSMEESRAFWQPLLEIVAGRHACDWDMEEVRRRLEAATTRLRDAGRLYAST